jgi:N6-adenosine-specific RNA methylase IME4
MLRVEALFRSKICPYSKAQGSCRLGSQPYTFSTLQFLRTRRMEQNKHQEGANHRIPRQVAETLSSIAYRSPSGLVNLIDLPTSIKLGQGLGGEDLGLELLSCKPLQHPYPSTEPKSPAALARLERRCSALVPGAIYEDLIEKGLGEVHAQRGGPWCLPRRIFRTKCLDEEDTLDCAAAAIEEPNLTTQVASAAPARTDFSSPSHVRSLPNPSSFRNEVFHNPHSNTIRLNITAPCSTFLIPPHSTFIPMSLDASTTSLTSLAALTAHTTSTLSSSSGEFDLILLDPPWPNRSARRAASYRQARDDPFCGLGEILPQHLAPGGFIACWTTHATATRDAVGELFTECEVDLVEEWVWSKVTENGEMSVRLGSMWRRGWEVLMIGKRRVDGESAAEAATDIVRRLIVSVPDLHSRKPCLKELFEEYLLRRGEGRVLEVFARHLTAGWCALGDEVLRFNWEGHWKRRDAKQG